MRGGVLAKGKGRIRCRKGKSCGSSCVTRTKICRIDISDSSSKSLNHLSKSISLKEKGLKIAEHGAIGVMAWKTGKVLAPVVSSYLESRFGVPREHSTKMSEVVIQAVTATALEARHLKDINSFTRKLIIESAAAFLGKTAHGQMETALSATEAKGMISSAAPIMAGKIAGITTATMGGKIPPMNTWGSLIAERSKADVGRLMEMVKPLKPSFAETSNERVAEFLANIAILSLITAYPDRV